MLPKTLAVRGGAFIGRWGSENVGFFWINGFSTDLCVRFFERI
jgi:hypothetical protein